MQVGQKLFYVPKKSYGRQPEPYEVEVLSVGRKWATVKHLIKGSIKISVDTMAADGGQYPSPGQCFYSRAAWEDAVEGKKQWDLFRKEVERHFNPPKQLSLEAIKTLADRAQMWGTE